MLTTAIYSFHTVFLYPFVVVYLFVRSMLQMKFSSLLIYFPSSLNPLWSFPYCFPFFIFLFFALSLPLRFEVWSKKDIMSFFQYLCNKQLLLPLTNLKASGKFLLFLNWIWLHGHFSLPLTSITTSASCTSLLLSIRGWLPSFVSWFGSKLWPNSALITSKHNTNHKRRNWLDPYEALKNT